LDADDGLWVDPATIWPGDVFVQHHRLVAEAATPAAIAFGLYDPMTGERIPTGTGQDSVELPLSGQGQQP
jgi:hypothetical protein